MEGKKQIKINPAFWKKAEVINELGFTGEDGSLKLDTSGTNHKYQGKYYHIHNPWLCVIFNINEGIPILEFDQDGNPKLDSKKTFDCSVFFKSFTSGFQQGAAYFQDLIKGMREQQTEYDKAHNLLAFYFSTEPQHRVCGWRQYIFKELIVLSDEKVKEYGFNEGILTEFYDTLARDPMLHKRLEKISGKQIPAVAKKIVQGDATDVLPDPLLYIKPELHNRLIEIENRIGGKFKSQVQCAAFCELLKEKSYFIGIKQSDTVNNKKIKSFALSRYNLDIKNQVLADKKTARESNKGVLSHYFN